MRRPTIVIGITTYRDLRDDEFALDVLRTLSANDPRLTPQAVNTHEPINIPLDAAGTWSRFWPQDALWRRKHTIQSGGMVRHRNGKTEDTTLAFHFRWNKTVDWWSLFSKLCMLTDPAHGMLHLFTPAECKWLDYQAFDDAVVGELAFTTAVAADGNYVRPDSWNTQARRSYRFLPELAWGNFLGGEFAGTYDPAGLARTTLHQDVARGVMFSLTSNIGDVADRPAEFETARGRARTVFVEGTFRRNAAD